MFSLPQETTQLFFMPQPDNMARVEFLSDYSSRDGRWDSSRAATDIISGYYQDEEYTRYAERTRECAKRLTMRLVTDEQGNSRFNLKSVFLCHVRMCPVCQVCRTRVWNNRFDQGLPKLIDENPTVRFIVLTLTVKNCDIQDLRSTLQTMSGAFAKFMKRAELKRVVLGYARSMEVTKSATGQAHPHFHVLLAVKGSYFSRDYINQSRWSELWRESLEVDYPVVVDVRVAKSKNKELKGRDGLKDAVREVAKYTVKVSDLVGDRSVSAQQWLIQLTNQLHGIKQMNLSGLFRKYINHGDESPEEILEAQNEPIEQVDNDENQYYFNWFRHHKKYGRFMPD